MKCMVRETAKYFNIPFVLLTRMRGHVDAFLFIELIGISREYPNFH